MPNELPPSTTKKLDIPFLTFLKIFVAAFVAFCVIKLAPLILLIILAVLTAVTLHPPNEWLVRKGLPRTVAFLIVAVVTLGVFAAFLGVIMPKVIEQMGTLPEHFGRVTKDLNEKIHNETLRAKLEGVLKDPQSVFGSLPERVLAAGSAAMGALLSIGMVLVLSLYLLADGKKTYAWLRAFFPEPTQKKIDATVDEMATIISAYVSGQMITSGLVAIFVFVVLSVTKVPAALSLSVLAAIFDILPLIGFIVSLVAAGLLALTVSGSAAIIVTLAFIGYHVVENYFIVPKVYGNRMRLSGLVVLLSLIVSVEVGGILAGIVILPIVAAYPIIEKIWLRRSVGRETIAEHVELEGSADPEPVGS